MTFFCIYEFLCYVNIFKTKKDCMEFIELYELSIFNIFIGY